MILNLYVKKFLPSSGRSYRSGYTLIFFLLLPLVSFTQEIPGKKELLEWVQGEPVQRAADSIYNFHLDYYYRYPDFGLQLASMVLQKSRQEKFLLGEGIAQIMMANATLYAFSKNVAMHHYDTAVTILEHLPPTRYLAFAYMYKMNSSETGFGKA